ncbi:MAG: HAMP domain-containing histidine kinase [Anaerolineaceae bacterium]|nr:MAG: HAMP domain-containing histidine kinase [Anaerolineaceae bacterium]
MLVSQIKHSRLGLSLLLKVVIYGLLSIILYFILTSIAFHYIDNMQVNLDSYYDNIKSTTEEFQWYITENNISIEDIGAIKAWDKGQSLMHIRLVENNKIIYDSMDYIIRFNPKISYIYYDHMKDISNIIEFYDGSATLYITILYKQRIEQRMTFAIASFCVLIFYLALFHEFKELVKDILEIKKGIEILEGGNLAFELQTNRKDEISELADSINRMSRELDFQRKEEEILRQKSNDLVTSISHDLRTPLTTINSYIDLILEEKYDDMNELYRYLDKIKDKSLQLSNLSDNLFTHFSNRNIEYKYRFETVIGNDFIGYLLNSLKEDLVDKGYQVALDNKIDKEFFLKVDIIQIQRVFNNLEGNLIKYASKSIPIIYSATLYDSFIKIYGKNHILNLDHIDSHGVGINTCKEIIRLHSGEMSTYIENQSYNVIINLPVYILSLNDNHSE